MFCRNEFELDLCIRMLLLQWDMFQPPKCSYIKKLCMNCGSKLFQDCSLFLTRPRSKVFSLEKTLPELSEIDAKKIVGQNI